MLANISFNFTECVVLKGPCGIRIAERQNEVLLLYKNRPITKSTFSNEIAIATRSKG